MDVLESFSAFPCESFHAICLLKGENEIESEFAVNQLEFCWKLREHRDLQNMFTMIICISYKECRFES